MDQLPLDRLGVVEFALDQLPLDQLPLDQLAMEFCRLAVIEVESGNEGAVAEGVIDPPVRWYRRPTTRVGAITVAMFIATPLVMLPVDDITSAPRAGHWWMYLFVAAAFALAMRFDFHIEYERHALSFTMSEIAVALAFAFFSPVGAISARVLVTMTVIWLMRRPPAYKLLFNAGMFALQTAFALTVIRLITGTSTDDGRLLIAVAVALTAMGLIESLLVAGAIACFEGGWFKQVRSGLPTSSILSPINALIGTMVLAPALILQELVFIAVFPVVAVWFIVRQYGRLGQAHRDLDALHGFSGLIAHSLQLDEIGDTAVREAARLLRADRAVLQVYDRDGALVATSNVGAEILGAPADRHDDRWSPFFEIEGAVDCSIDQHGTVIVDAPGRHRTLAVSIRDADTVIGVLIVTDRAGGLGVFGAPERSRAVTLAGQLSSSLRRALLHANMEHAALHDALTGKPNRLAFETVVRDSIMWGGGTSSAVLMLDLNRFKEVNDTLGHHVGDRVLCEFANRIEQLLDPDDVLARFGGDEFAILVTRPTDEAIHELADRILADSFNPMSLDELDVVVTTSIGIAPLDGRDAATVLRHADIAMYAAKRECTAIEVYREEIDRRSPERLSLLGSLRQALENDVLEVHFQPKVDLVSSTVVSAEALVRWCHPTRGWVSPIDFIQVAEESGLIKQVTDQVLALSIQAARGWHDAGYDLAIAVNLSAHDLLDEQLPTRIGDLLTKHGLAAEKLTLEITESALLADTPRTSSTVQRLNELGVKLSLDDFGTGYSSLGYLRRLPVSELKIDQSFVKNLLLDDQDIAIVRSTIDLGHNLGLQVVAEGIENTPTLERLRSLGCDIGQGYGIARPLAPDLFMTWLTTTEYAMPKPISDMAN